MMKTTLVITSALSAEIASACTNPLETAGVLLVRYSEIASERRLLAHSIEWVPDEAYLVRKRDRLSISSAGYVRALSHAENLGATAIWVHTHPRQIPPLPSPADRRVDAQIANVFRIRSGSPYYAALIFSPRDGGYTFSGYLQSENGETFPIDSVWAVGDRLARTQSYDRTPSAFSPQLFDRNIRAFGAAVQDTLSTMKVGIVGCGGTGSAVAEQLVRLGVRRFLLADPDTLSESNVTRVYGSFPADIGRPKVDVTAEHIQRIASDARVESIRASITAEPIARKLAGCDVIFGCTDDNAGRLVLSRLSTYYLIPVFDCGVLLSSDATDAITGIHGRITTLVPGQACLVCRDRIDLRRAATELLIPEERARRVDEGYAPALGRVEPAVVSYTSAVASIAVGELLERLIGYGPTPRPSEVLIRLHEREMSTNVEKPRDGHYCSPNSNKIGIGDRTPFLDQAWPS
jgi:molybdopterin/thiamine biosynthesis adenylyltransferase/proteasome lid subunit RPN8/RPN11